MEKFSNPRTPTPNSKTPELMNPKEPNSTAVSMKFTQIGKGLQVQKLNDEKSQFVHFNPISESQLIKEPAHARPLYSKDLCYKLHKTEARLVRSILENSGFSYTDSHDWNLLWLGCVPPLYLYEGLHELQRINHFPNSYEITRKDRMTVNLKNMQAKFSEYDFFPETYVIPDEYSEFYHRFMGGKEQWIVKPCNSSQGKGIFLLDNLQNLPSVEGCVVSKYLNDPMLIDGLKFDMRIYVLITSYEPLRIYIYDEGLVRFASEPYSNSSKASKYSFLTNYSINKKNEKFVQNLDIKQDNIGHKWSLSALMKFLAENSIDTQTVTSNIYDLIIKTIIAIEPSVVTLCKKMALGKNNCFDLLGFDIILDSDLKPWLLEVNLSPSLATDSPLDLKIKSNLIADTLNLVGVKQYDRKKECLNKLKARIRARKNQMKAFDSKVRSSRPESRMVTERISFSKFKSFIADLIDEENRLGNFVRIFPCEDSEKYEKFFLIKRKSNKALLTFISTTVVPEIVPAVPEEKLVEEKTKEQEKEKEKDIEKDKSKLVITGDDLLIEYLSRLLHACKSVSIAAMKTDWKINLEKFVSHSVWSLVSPAVLSQFNIVEKLNIRICEMKERRMKGEVSRDHYHSQKHQIVRSFSALQLENMIRSSNKTSTKEVISFLFFNNSGMLSEIIKWLASSSMKKPKSAKGVKRNGSLNNEGTDKSKQ